MEIPITRFDGSANQPAIVEARASLIRFGDVPAHDLEPVEPGDTRHYVAEDEEATLALASVKVPSPEALTVGIHLEPIIDIFAVAHTRRESSKRTGIPEEERRMIGRVLTKRIVLDLMEDNVGSDLLIYAPPDSFTMLSGLFFFPVAPKTNTTLGGREYRVMRRFIFDEEATRR